MAKTRFETNNALTKKIFEEKLFRDVVKESYFTKFSGSDQSSIVYKKEDLVKSKGDTITFGLRMRLSGAGVTGRQQLEGNEESLTTHSNTVTLERYRHGVRDNGQLDRQRTAFNISAESRQAIQDWGSEKIDKLCFDELVTARTKALYTTSAGNTGATEATAKAALTVANGKLTLPLISFAKTWAQTGGGRAYVPLRPIRVDGKDTFVLLTHPDALYDLKTSSAWQQAQREAEARGKSNPIFSGAVGFWDGVVIHEHENMPIAADAGASSNVPWAKAVLLGAQSLCWADGERPSIVQEKFDYEEEEGYCWRATCGVARSEFNSLEYGSVGLYVARTNVSGV